MTQTPHTEPELIEGESSLDARKAKGEKILRATWGRPVEGDDRESAASDAISDVLTALFGPAGTTSVGGSITLNEFALNEARALIEHAMRSYEGDAEDYTRTPEPGEYGYEGD